MPYYHLKDGTTTILHVEGSPWRIDGRTETPVFAAAEERVALGTWERLDQPFEAQASEAPGKSPEKKGKK